MFAIKSIALALATFAIASAVPVFPTDNSDDDITVNQAVQKCGDHTVLACCDTLSNNGGSVLSGLNLLGGNCHEITTAVFGGAVPLSSTCGNKVACCSGNQVGLVNAQCNNVF